VGCGAKPHGFKERTYNMKELLDLYITFAKMGAVCFGGGYAMLPLIQREVVENRGWATEEEVLDYYAIGQCTPGIIAVNTSTFIGHKVHGISGGIIATLGFVTPSLIIILVIAGILQNIFGYPIVENAFSGIRVCVCVLIANAVVKLWKKSVTDWVSVLIFILVFGISVMGWVSSVVLIVAAGVIGFIVKTIKEGKAK
jgi:chromate transporter